MDGLVSRLADLESTLSLELSKVSINFKHIDYCLTRRDPFRLNELTFQHFQVILDSFLSTFRYLLKRIEEEISAAFRLTASSSIRRRIESIHSTLVTNIYQISRYISRIDQRLNQ